MSVALLARNSAVAMAGGVASQALKFVIYIYVARRFSSAEFGSLSFAIAVYAFMFVISHFGLPVFGARQVAKRGRVSRSLVTAVLCSRACLAVLATGLALAALWFVQGVTRQESILVAVFGLSNLALAGFPDWAFQGLGRQGVSAVLNALCQALWLLLVVAGVQAGAGIVVVPVALCLSAFISAALGYVWLRRSGVLESHEGDALLSLAYYS
ncbi:MAG: oligosaccharide flippase family protein [Acidobacteria bacterium]|nr:oligosaccharide flippase family protein [Acidobacteriota bacterium]